MDYKAELEEIKKEVQMKSTEEEKSITKPVENLTKATEFTKAVETAKISTVAKASAEDEKFNEDFKQELKQAVLKSAQLEREKQELEKKNIELQQQYIRTKQEQEAHTQEENKWDNKRARRQYHYDGLKDIMLFMHIDNPMFIPLMYLFALIGSIVYIPYVLIISPIGTLLGGKKDSERPKIMKGAIYTVLFVSLIGVVSVLFYLAGHYLCHWF